MFSDERVTAATIKAVFAEEIAAQQGSVTEAVERGECLFLRSLLPLQEEVRPRDRVQGGVALRSNGCDVWLHPYVFRLVCRNGAIMARATQTHHLVDLHGLPAEEAIATLRQAVRICCLPDAFTEAAQQMRTAQEASVDIALMMLPMLSRLPQDTGAQLFQEILGRSTVGGDNSAFGLMNAVTATARDTRDPELRWRLEEFGGGIAALRIPEPTPGSAGAVRERGEAVLVG